MYNHANSLIVISFPSISAVKHSENIVVTASINNVSFGEPVPLGSILTIEAKVSRAFSTSMEVFIDVWIQNKKNRKKLKLIRIREKNVITKKN